MSNEQEQERRANEALKVAASLVCDVRDSAEDVEATLAGLDRQQLVALAVVLAAMVPDNRTQAQLLGWLVPLKRADWQGRPDQVVRAAHASFERLAKRRRAGIATVIPDEIREGEREYQRRRKARLRAVAS